MSVLAQAGAQSAESVRLAMVIVAVAVVAFHRVIIRVLLRLLAVAVVAAVGYGAVRLLH